MLRTSGYVVDSMFVDNLCLDFERRELIFLSSVKEDKVWAESPRVERFFVPAKAKLWAGWDSFELLLNLYGFKAFYVDVFLLELLYCFYGRFSWNFKLAGLRLRNINLMFNLALLLYLWLLFLNRFPFNLSGLILTNWKICLLLLFCLFLFFLYQILFVLRFNIFLILSFRVLFQNHLFLHIFRQLFWFRILIFIVFS